MTRILALMKYGRRAASTRQRLLQYEPYLNAHGFSIEMSPLLDDAHVERLARGKRSTIAGNARALLRRLGALVRARNYDVLWVHCETFPYLPGAIERLIRLAQKPILFDYDDAIFHMYDRHRRPIVRRLLGGKLAPLLRSASVCLCGNAYLRDYAARYCPDSIIVPTVVDTDRYVPRPEAGAGRPPVVGWIGSPSTWAYVAPLLPGILPLLKARGIRLRAVGAGAAAQGIEGVDAVEWSEAREIAEVQAMDIGIMPLPDEPWAHGKCGYKLIQYMACGLPVVASPVGVNSEIVTAGENGFLAEGPQDWILALERLIDDPALRRAMGERGRARIVERYSLAAQAPRVLAALRMVAEQGP